MQGAQKAPWRAFWRFDGARGSVQAPLRAQGWHLVAINGISGALPAKLTTKQRAAVAALLVERDAKSTALVCGVPYRTMLRWLEREDFRQAVADAERELLGVTLRRLTSSTAQAIDVLNAGMGPEHPIAARVRAAGIVLGKISAIYELASFEGRLSDLEERANATFARLSDGIL